MSRVKFHSESEFIAEMAWIMWERCQQQLKDLKIDAISFVPATKAKINRRGFNQAEKVARLLGKYLQVEVKPLITRLSQVRSQIGMGVSERSVNVKNQFFPVGKQCIQKLLLVDDVMTTGATLEACASKLKLVGVEQIYGLVFARNPEFAIENMI